MPSITAALKEAAEKATIYREESGWVLSVYDEATGCPRLDPVDNFWSVSERCRQARIEYALRLLGVEDAAWYASNREGTYTKVVRDVMAAKGGRCRHRDIIINGSEDDGLRSISCRTCGAPMTRRIVDGNYEYEVLA